MPRRLDAADEYRVVPAVMNRIQGAVEPGQAVVQDRSTLMAKARCLEIRPWLRAFLSMQARIRGGLSDSEQNELTVIPRMPPSRSVVRTATPLAQRRRAPLN